MNSIKLPHRQIFFKWFLILVLFLFFSCSYLPEFEENTVFENIQSETADYILLYNDSIEYDRIFLFIPGGLVDPHVYLCWMDDLVKEVPGMAIVSMKFPTNLAIVNRGKIARALDDFNEVEDWVIGGHSLGGVVAAKEIEEQPDVFKGLILLGSWTTSYADLHSWDGYALSLYGSNDGLSSPEEVFENEIFLPQAKVITSPSEIIASDPVTFYYEIIGANHSGFGCYGLQEGDNAPDISQDIQQEEMRQMIRTFLKYLWPEGN